MKIKRYILKNLLSVILLSGINAYTANSQTEVTRYTPLGSPVRVYNDITEMLNETKIKYSDKMSTLYPEAEELNEPSATNYYNCHAYAWHITQGGDWVWIGLYTGQTADEDIYWNDGSYIKLNSESGAEKISYYKGNHSAVQTQTQGTYISKWGPGPLMRHSNNYGPTDYDMDYRYYYALPEISGENILCNTNSVSYHLQDFKDVTYDWTTSSNLQITGSKTNRNISVYPVSTSGAEAWLRASIYIPEHNKTRLITKKIWLGVPGVPTTNPTGYPTVQLSLGSILTIRVTNAPGAVGSNYTWDITGSIQKMSGSSNVCVAEATSYGSGNYRVKTSNKCGIGHTGGGSVYVKKNGGGGPVMVSVFPNPVKDVLNVELQQLEVDRTYTEEVKEVYLYDKQNKLIRHEKIEGNSKQINLNGLNPDLYFVKIKIGEDIYTEKIMISK